VSAAPPGADPLTRLGSCIQFIIGIPTAPTLSGARTTPPGLRRPLSSQQRQPHRNPKPAPAGAAYDPPVEDRRRRPRHARAPAGTRGSSVAEGRRSSVRVGFIDRLMDRHRPQPRAWWVGRHPVLGLRRRGRQSRRDGVEIGMDSFAARTSHRLTCQPPLRERSGSEQPGSQIGSRNAGCSSRHCDRWSKHPRYGEIGYLSENLCNGPYGVRINRWCGCVQGALEGSISADE
jgi:hypothetical protein